MVSLDKAVIARLKSHSKLFELWIDPDLAHKYKKDREIELSDLLAVQDVFKDATKGLRASREDLKEIFGTTKLEQVVKKVIRKGKIHIPVERKRMMREQKRNKIASLIARRSINPKTKKPHPQERIELAMKEAGVSVKALKPASEQVKRVIEQLQAIIPIATGSMKLQIKIPSKYVGKLYGKIKEQAAVEKEEWLSDGSWHGLLKIQAGMQPEFLNLVNKLSEGEAIVKEK